MGAVKILYYKLNVIKAATKLSKRYFSVEWVCYMQYLCLDLLNNDTQEPSASSSRVLYNHSVGQGTPCLTSNPKFLNIFQEPVT
jgi:hypothetical protein